MLPPEATSSRTGENLRSFYSFCKDLLAHPESAELFLVEAKGLKLHLCR
jgi:hypothetical protein